MIDGIEQCQGQSIVEGQRNVKGAMPSTHI